MNLQDIQALKEAAQLALLASRSRLVKLSYQIDRTRSEQKRNELTYAKHAEQTLFTALQQAINSVS
jgi:hypothetical protein